MASQLDQQGTGRQPCLTRPRSQRIHVLHKREIQAMLRTEAQSPTKTTMDEGTRLVITTASQIKTVKATGARSRITVGNGFTFRWVRR